MREAQVAQAALRLARRPGVRRLQMDFEVRASERPILLAVLRGVRAGLPEGIELSMTALASWCDTETWLDEAPVDEIVPMLFRMGPGGERLKARLAAGGDFANPRCRRALAVSADTPLARAPAGRRVYLFNPRSWTAASFERVRREVAAWRGRLSGLVAAAAVALGWPSGAHASGPGSEAPWYLDQFGGETADLARLYDGQLGIVMARSPRPQLYLAWRLLHGQKVGPAAGAALSTPCCDPPWRWRYEAREDVGVDGWLKARKAVPGVAEIAFLSTDRDGPNYTSIVNCFDEAFDTASATLKDRAAKSGVGSPEIRAWLDTQDAVFQACHDPDARLPAAMPGGPAWLKADRAYQAAAFELYQGRNSDAAIRFAAIAKDKASPWRPLAPYLRTRALVRSALAEKTGDSFAAARAAITALAKAPPGAFGQGEARKMRHLLDFRDRPKQLMAELDRELAAKEASPDIAVSFRDYASLSDKGVASPDALDWIATLRAQPDRKSLDAAEAAGGVEDLATQGPDRRPHSRPRSMVGQPRPRVADRRPQPDRPGRPGSGRTRRGGRKGRAREPGLAVRPAPPRPPHPAQCGPGRDAGASGRDPATEQSLGQRPERLQRAARAGGRRRRGLHSVRAAQAALRRYGREERLRPRLLAVRRDPAVRRL